MIRPLYIGIWLIAFIIIFAAGCAPRADRAVPWPFAEDKFVFIEFRQEEDGRVIRGEFPPGPMIDFPTYMFDPHSETLASHDITFTIDDTLKVILGRSTALRGVAGGGMSSKLTGIFSLPYRSDDITIRGVDEHGNAYILFDNEQIVIESGDEWTHFTTRRDTIGTTREQSIAEFTNTTRIINYGVLDKSNIRKW